MVTNKEKKKEKKKETVKVAVKVVKVAVKVREDWWRGFLEPVHNNELLVSQYQ